MVYVRFEVVRREVGIKLVCGPAGSGKTNTAIDALLEYSPFDWAGKVRYVVPTTQMARAVSATVMERAGLSGVLGNVFCTFYSFANEILTSAGISNGLISDIQKNLLLEKLVSESDLSYLRKSSRFPGFVGALDGIIGELKTSVVTPEDFQNAVETTDCGSRKIKELSALYRSYQKDILEKYELHDREGLMWRALEVLRTQEFLKEFDLVIFDGFNSLNGVQRAFLELISAQVPNAMVTLCYEPDRPEVFDSIKEVRQFILGLGASETTLQRPDNGQSALRYLEQNLFTASSGQVLPDNNVTILEGGNPTIEIELVADEIRKLVRDNGCRFSDIAVTARDINGYTGRIERIFDDKDIPLEHSGISLIETSAARLLKSCIGIIRNSWDREDVVCVLKSELMGGDLALACRAEVDSKQSGITEGRENWFACWGEDDRTQAFRTELLQKIVKFEDKIRAASNTGQRADVIQHLVDSFKLRKEDDDLFARDSAAVKAIINTLNDLKDALELVNKKASLDEFLDLFESSLARVQINVQSYQPDCVRVVPVNNIAGQRFGVVFVLGLLEKSFPRQIREESFLRDNERITLNLKLPNKLKLWLPMQSEERNLFYSAVGAAVDKLYLCYPLADSAAKDSLPSFYLDEVRKLFSESMPVVRRDVSDQIPDVIDAQSVSDLEHAAVFSLSQLPESKAADAATVYNSLVSEDPDFTSVFSDCEDYDGRIDDSTILSLLAKSNKIYRCTELETYALCPFMHFCQKILGLEPIRDEIGGLDIGNILHQTLYRLFKQLSEEKPGFVVKGLEKEATLQLGRDILNEEFEGSARLCKLPAHESDILLHTLQAYLKRYLTSEIAKGWEDFSPSYFELEFGSTAQPDRPRDPKSIDKPLEIEYNNRKLRICGKMDRVDLSPNGALIIDYKLSQYTKITDFDKGLVLQAMVYALAMKKLFKQKVAGTEYKPIKKWGPDGYYIEESGISKRNRVFSEEVFDEMLKRCESFVGEIVSSIRNGEIPIDPKAPDKGCNGICPYRGICRMDDYKLLLMQPLEEEANGTEAEE